MSYGPVQQQPPAWSPHLQRPGMPPSRKGSGWGWIIAGLVGLAGCGAFALCCGGGIWIVSFGFGVMTAEVEDKLRENASVREHLGEIQEFKLDFTRSMADDDDDTYVYKVKGTKSSGTIKVKHVTDEDGNEQIISATLRTDSGQHIELVP